jgi:hypothetical protein
MHHYEIFYSLLSKGVHGVSIVPRAARAHFTLSWKLDVSYKFFVCLHGDKTYNSFVCGNTT